MDVAIKLLRKQKENLKMIIMINLLKINLMLKKMSIWEKKLLKNYHPWKIVKHKKVKKRNELIDDN
jgi:hypothetical protein